MALTSDEVRKIAKLARLKLTDQEISLYQEQLGDVLGYIETLSEVDVRNVAMTSQVSGLTTVLAEDKVRPGLDSAASLKNAPTTDGTYIKVKAVFADS